MALPCARLHGCAADAGATAFGGQRCGQSVAARKRSGGVARADARCRAAAPPPATAASAGLRRWRRGRAIVACGSAVVRRTARATKPGFPLHAYNVYKQFY